MLRPKNNRIERFRASGDDRRVNAYLSCAYLLHSVAYMLYDDADELLAKHGLRMGTTKRLSNRLQTAYDGYFRDFVPMIKESGQSAAYFADLDKLAPVLRRAAMTICGFCEQGGDIVSLPKATESAAADVEPFSSQEAPDDAAQNLDAT